MNENLPINFCVHTKMRENFPINFCAQAKMRERTYPLISVHRQR